jgi:hypothetical protein
MHYYLKVKYKNKIYNIVFLNYDLYELTWNILDEYVLISCCIYDCDLKNISDVIYYEENVESLKKIFNKIL